MAEFGSLNRHMPKTPEQIKPNYGPVYTAAMYPDLAKIFIKHGYALAVHGSLARDFDLVGIPWAETVSPPANVLNDVAKDFAVTMINYQPEIKNHGRMVYTLACGFGDCCIDLSFLPLTK